MKGGVLKGLGHESYYKYIEVYRKGNLVFEF